MKTITIDGVQIPTDKLIEAGWKAPEVKKSVVWEFEIGERFYYINLSGIVTFGRWFDECIYMFDMGNVYRTPAEAQRAVDVIRATVRVNRRIAELNEGWVPDWQNKDQKKWLFNHRYRNQGFGVFAWYAYDFYPRLFPSKSESIGEKIITEMHDDLCTIWGIEKEGSK